MGTGRRWKRNQFWRKRRSKEHRQRKTGGDTLAFSSTDRKSHLLTKNCIFTAFLIHIQNGIILLCSPFFACLVMNQFHFHARTRRKHWTWNDLWYYNKYKPSIWDVCIVVCLNGPLLQWDKVLNVFLEFCILVNNLFSLPVYSNWKWM